jgi:hypothetical protein
LTYFRTPRGSTWADEAEARPAPTAELAFPCRRDCPRLSSVGALSAHRQDDPVEAVSSPRGMGRAVAVRTASAGGKDEGNPARRVAWPGPDGDHVCAGRRCGGRTRIRTWVGASRRFYRSHRRLSAGPLPSPPDPDHRPRRAQTARRQLQLSLGVPACCTLSRTVARRAEGKWREIPPAIRPSVPHRCREQGRKSPAQLCGGSAPICPQVGAVEQFFGNHRLGTWRLPSCRR